MENLAPAAYHPFYILRNTFDRKPTTLLLISSELRHWESMASWLVSLIQKTTAQKQIGEKKVHAHHSLVMLTQESSRFEEFLLNNWKCSALLELTTKEQAVYYSKSGAPKSFCPVCPPLCYLMLLLF